MPDIDGYQVLEKIKQSEGLGDPAVIAITANAMHSDIEKGMQAGFNDYLTKPLNVEEFLALIDRYLSSHDDKRSL